MSSCIYGDVYYPFVDDLYILKLTLTLLSLVRDRVLNYFTKVHQFDLVLTDTENMTSHYVVLCQNTNT